MRTKEPAHTKSDLDLDQIRAIVDQIAEAFHPVKVVLFGSHANGNATTDSDVDLLVVMESEEPALQVAAQIAAGIDHPFPLDILVSTPKNWNASLARRASFATTVDREGIVLYEAGDRGVASKG